MINTSIVCMYLFLWIIQVYTSQLHSSISSSYPFDHGRNKEKNMPCILAAQQRRKDMNSKLPCFLPNQINLFKFIQQLNCPSSNGSKQLIHCTPVTPAPCAPHPQSESSSSAYPPASLPQQDAFSARQLPGSSSGDLESSYPVPLGCH